MDVSRAIATALDQRTMNVTNSQDSVNVIQTPMVVSATNVNLDSGHETSPTVNRATATVTRRLATRELENVCNVATSPLDSIVIVALKDIMVIRCWEVKLDVVHAAVRILELRDIRLLTSAL